MKKVFIVMIFAAMTFVAAQASAQPKGDRVKERVERLSKELQLTTDQASEIENIYRVQAENRKKQFEQMRNSGQRPDMQAMHAQMAKERADVDARIAKVLTPEQYEKYKRMQAEQAKMRNRHGKKGGEGYGKGAGKAPGNMPENGPEKRYGKRDPMHGGNGGFAKMKEELQLTDAQVEQFKQLKRDQQIQKQEEIKRILTPEQYEKFQQMKRPANN